MDIFGRALRDHQSGDGKHRLTLRRDDGHADTHLPGTWFPPHLWPAEKLLAPLVQGRILDIGCGAGRHLTGFRDQGEDITGIDISDGAVDVCRARGHAMVYERDIMADTIPGAPYDTILLFGNNIGIAGDLAGAAHLLGRLKDATTPGGQLLIASRDVHITRDKQHLTYSRRNLDDDRQAGQMRMRMEYRDMIGGWFDWLHPTPDELRQIADQSGWQVDRLETARKGAYGARLIPVVAPAG